MNTWCKAHTEDVNKKLESYRMKNGEFQFTTIEAQLEKFKAEIERYFKPNIRTPTTVSHDSESQVWNFSTVKIL